MRKVYLVIIWTITLACIVFGSMRFTGHFTPFDGTTKKGSQSLEGTLNSIELNGDAFDVTIQKGNENKVSYRSKYKPEISLSPAFSRSQQRAMPTDDELFRAVQNLEDREMKVDYIVTHTAPYTLALVCEEMIFPEECRLLSILDHVFDKGSYTQWFFGRYRKDKSSLHSKVTACWDNLYRVQ